uniref:Phosphatidylinositol N-acetylglucosaminyltransferase subunit C n=1 Tax=Globodera rostochiensis TaxID=31243 RepID=A0A914IAI2_GLORO
MHRNKNRNGDCHRWEKVLYKRQPFPDNHTDETLFLDQLRTNVGLVHYSFLSAFCGACVVMAHLDLVVLFLCCFELVQSNAIGPLALFWIGAVDAGVQNNVFRLWGTFSYIGHNSRVRIRIYTGDQVSRTLTTSISTDSIYASAILLFVASLVVHDYGINVPVVSLPLSANLCLAASVFLISRLQSDLMAFLLLALSLCLFCFWPRLRNALFDRWHLLPPLTLLPLSVLSTVALAQLVEPQLAFMHFLLHLSIVLFCPWLFVRMQSIKSTIHGPWDEATLRASIEEK